MSRPTFSIVTPSYNQAEYIRDTLDSVATQTYPNVEHLVFDGGSSDDTVDILAEYEDAYNLTWVSESDEGQSNAINAGFRQSTGDIVAWLNSDDMYFDTGVLKRVAGYFAKTSADVIYGDLAYVDQNSVITAMDVRPEFDADKLPYRILIGQPAAFFSRAVVETEKLDEALDYSMDYEYWLRLSRRFEFRHFRDVFAGFRIYPEQKSQNSEAMAEELQEILIEYSELAELDSNVIFDNLSTETLRLLRAARLTIRYHRNTPELAFEGELAPLIRMLLNLGPGFTEVTKAWRRWRSGGASG